MSFSSDLAEIRYGYGFSPGIAPVASLPALLAAPVGPDVMAATFPVERFDTFLQWTGRLQKMRADAQKSANKSELMEKFRAERLKGRAMASGWAAQMMLRRALSPEPFRERLVAFWADHFTAFGKTPLMRPAGALYIEEAIRPNIAGRFGDLLVAAVTQPVMLAFLDQMRSVGENSRAAKRNKRLDGLNENLAREVLELHTLGVGGPYTQADVRQLAELFTGMSFNPARGFVFRPAFAEPGAETVLNRSYGGGRAQFEPVAQALHDLAVHPATANHIARKLVVHFVSDTPDAGLVAHVAARFLATGGDLTAVYAALLEHPAAWVRERRNIKPPVDFFASAWRALGVEPDHVQSLKFRQMLRLHFQPLQKMGQPWLRPSGPDGWDEQDDAWITPQGLAMRLNWSLTAPRRLVRELPDPREFVDVALGRFATPEVRFAAKAAESQAEAIALILTSPAFQRR